MAWQPVAAGDERRLVAGGYTDLEAEQRRALPVARAAADRVELSSDPYGHPAVRGGAAPRCLVAREGGLVGGRTVVQLQRPHRVDGACRAQNQGDEQEHTTLEDPQGPMPADGRHPGLAICGSAW